jgi:hypothetical protein
LRFFCSEFPAFSSFFFFFSRKAFKKKRVKGVKKSENPLENADFSTPPLWNFPLNLFLAKITANARLFLLIFYAAAAPVRPGQERVWRPGQGRRGAAAAGRVRGSGWVAVVPLDARGDSAAIGAKISEIGAVLSVLWLFLFFWCFFLVIRGENSWKKLWFLQF